MLSLGIGFPRTGLQALVSHSMQWGHEGVPTHLGECPQTDACGRHVHPSVCMHIGPQDGWCITRLVDTLECNWCTKTSSSGQASQIVHGTRQVCACMSGDPLLSPSQGGHLVPELPLHAKLPMPLQPLVCSVGLVDSRSFLMMGVPTDMREHAVLRAYAVKPTKAAGERET